MVRLLKLTKRLGLIASYIDKGAAVIDIGTDHGMLPIYLAQNGHARRIIATDINDGPLSAAHRNAAEYNVRDKIKFVLTPGLCGIGEDEADTVVIAGMGGENIAEIIDDAPWLKSRGMRLILQPQTKVGELCRRLSAGGYIIRDAALAYEGGRFYIVILAFGGEYSAHEAFADDDAAEIALYSLLAAKRDAHIISFLDGLISKTQRIAAESANSEAGERFEKKLRELQDLKKEAEL